MKLATLTRLWRSGWRLMFLLALPALLVACGGSGAGAQGGASATAAGAAGSAGDAQVQITADKSVLDSNRVTPVKLTAVVVDGNGVVQPNRVISWGVQDSAVPAGVRLEGAVTRTDASGRADATLVLSGDQGNRNVKVTATNSGVVGTIDIAVAGTSIAISGPQTVPLNGSASRFTLTLKDSGGLGIAGKSLTVSSSSGNSLTTTTPVTDQSGQAIVDLIGTVAGADTLTVNGLGTGASFPISVAGESLQVSPTLLEIPIGVDTPVNVLYTRSGGIPPGSTVTLVATRGQVVGSSTASIASGGAVFNVRSTTAGPVSFVATVGTAQGSANASFISTTPASLDLQATPTILGPNQAGQTTERSTLIATVRDLNGNPVKGRIIAFSNTTDPSGGSIDPPTAISDAAGRATATFIAGPQTSSPNGVQVTASVIGTALTSQALLSVSRTTLFVRVGAGDNVVKRDAPPTYTDRFAVVVTDSTGNPVANAQVLTRLTPLSYRTGSLCVGDLTSGCLATGTRYVPNPATVSAFLPSEDSGAGNPANARDGICQVGEDANGDRQLTPGNVAAATQVATTATDGTALIEIAYPQQFAFWTRVILEVTAKVGGSEGASSTVFNLTALASDWTDVSKTPAFYNSPYPYTSENPTCP